MICSPHARSSGGIGIRAYDPDLEAQGELVEEPVAGHGREDRQDDAGVAVAADEDRQGGVAHVLGDRGR